MLWRVPVNGAVTVEEARALATGARDEDQSGYIHTELRGSTLAKTGWDAQMSLPFEEAEYGAWGETLRVSTNPVPTHQFVGFEPDPATGWYFMGARVYDPTLRRWLSPDPLLLVAPEMNSAEGIELNLYSYAGNNPIIYTDPDGTCRRDGAKVDCFSAAWESYQEITAATQASFDEGNYGDAAVGMVLGTAQTVNVGSGYVAQGYADVWNAVVDAKGGSYTPLAVAATTALIPLPVARGKLLGTLGKRASQQSSNVLFRLEKKTQDQLTKRGWNKKCVQDLINSPVETKSVRDTRRLPKDKGGGRRDDPATAYLNKEGHYVIVNDTDKTVVQISNKNKSEWRAAWGND